MHKYAKSSEYFAYYLFFHFQQKARSALAFCSRFAQPQMPFPARRAGTQRRFQCFSRKFWASALDTAQKYVMIMDTDFTKGSVPHASLSRPHFELYPQGGRSLLRGAGRAGLHSFCAALRGVYFLFRLPRAVPAFLPDGRRGRAAWLWSVRGAGAAPASR